MSPDASRRPWLGADTWAISLSAFFADLGYQAVQAGFPLLLVLTLHAPVWSYGLATALSYGGGSLFAYFGGRLGDRLGHRRVALVGNSLIPLLSLSGLLTTPVAAIAFLTLGWWARNVRTPSRRVMFTEAVPETHRNEAFGFLHALDVAGGILAAVYVLVLLAQHVAWRWIFLGTALPLAASTLTLARARTGQTRTPPPAPEESPRPPRRPAGFAPLLWSAGLYGLSYYSVGFPVLTAAQKSGQGSMGVLAFLLFQLVSSFTGFSLAPYLGTSRAGRLQRLAVLGYLPTCLGSLLLAAGFALPHGPWLVFLGVALLGAALGVVETLEPALMSLLAAAGYAGQGFGALTAARSLGLFLANLVLGLLYQYSALASYAYAALLAFAAAAVLFLALPSVRREESASMQTS